MDKESCKLAREMLRQSRITSDFPESYFLMMHIRNYLLWCLEQGYPMCRVPPEGLEVVGEDGEFLE